MPGLQKYNADINSGGWVEVTVDIHVSQRMKHHDFSSSSSIRTKFPIFTYKLTLNKFQ